MFTSLPILLLEKSTLAYNVFLSSSPLISSPIIPPLSVPLYFSHPILWAVLFLSPWSLLGAVSVSVYLRPFTQFS